MDEKMRVSRQLWYFMIKGKTDDEKGAYGNFYSYGTHLGDALDKVLSSVEIIDLYEADVIEASWMNQHEDFDPTQDTVQIAEDVIFRGDLHMFPLRAESEDEEDEPEFIAPVGIVKADRDDKISYDLIKEAFVAFGKNDEGIFELELVVEKSKLISTFLEAIDSLPEVTGISICLKDHWEAQEDEWLHADYFKDHDLIKSFFTQNIHSTLENGYIECLVHSQPGDSTLTLDDHKKIQFHTKDNDVFNKFGRRIMDLGFKQTKELYDLEFGYHHWHYRPTNSPGRNEMKMMLMGLNFKKQQKA